MGIVEWSYYFLPKKRSSAADADVVASGEAVFVRLSP